MRSTGPLFLLATLSAALDIPFHGIRRFEQKNGTRTAAGLVGQGESASSIIAAVDPTASLGRPFSTFQAPSATAIIGNGNAAINASNFNVSTSIVATVSSTSVATSTLTVETTLLIANGTATSVIPTTLVLTKTSTVLVYFTPALNGKMLPVSTAKAVVTAASESIMLSLSKSVGSETLTYTMGSGNLITTTVEVTKIVTLTRTKTSSMMENPSVIAIQDASSVQASPTAASDAAADETVTVKATSTITKTVFRTESPSAVGSSVADAGSNQGIVGAQASESVQIVTVTMTFTEKSTRYITAAASGKSSSIGNARQTQGSGSAPFRNGTAPVTSTRSNSTLARPSHGMKNSTLSSLTKTASPTTSNLPTGRASIQTAPASSSQQAASQPALATGRASIQTMPSASSSASSSSSQPIDPQSASLINLATAKSSAVSTIFASPAPTLANADANVNANANDEYIQFATPDPPSRRFKRGIYGAGLYAV